ncbi:hypothetical protein H312_03305, partial [Anncaliia algerae PRA339]
NRRNRRIKIGKRKFNRGHRIEGVWVFGLVERTPKRKILLFSVKKRYKNTLLQLIKNHVRNGSIIYSDCWRAYNNIGTESYLHVTVNHSKSFINYDNGVHTNTIEGNWSSIKMTVPKSHRKLSFIGMYLVKYMIKRNEEGDLGYNLLKYLV